MTNPFGQLTPSEGGNYVSWQGVPVGTEVTGTILRLWTEIPPFEDAEECPHFELRLDDGEVKTLRASQTVLRNLCIARGDEFHVGARITFRFSGTAGQAKLFEVTVTPAAVAAAPAAEPVAAAPAPAAAVGQAPPLA
jgi:hypothetical protein